MLTKEEKEKNIKDLEYNHLLNKQNVFLGLIGAFIISVLFSNNLPEGLDKKEILLFLILTGILAYTHFNQELNKIIDSIKKIKTKL